MSSRGHSKIRRYSLEGEVNREKRTETYRVFIKELTYAHELFEVGAFRIFLNFLFCFSILLFFVSPSGRLIALQIIRLDSREELITCHDFDCLLVDT